MGNQVAVNYLHAFLDRHVKRTFKKGEIIVFQGEAPRSAYVVKGGTVKAYNLSVEGDEKPVDFYGKDSVFPAAWVYGKMPNAIYYYEAFTPTVEVYVLDRGEYADFIRKRPELLYQELERSLVAQVGESLRLNALQHSRASDKLIYTLHYLALSHGEPAQGKKISLKLDLKHQDFANLTGLTRETAATELNKLKKKGIIDYGKGRSYQLDMTRLKQSLSDQFVSDMDVGLET